MMENEASPPGSIRAQHIHAWLRDHPGEPMVLGYRVDMRDLDLTGLNLAGAQAHYGDFRGACLDDANFTGADLRNAQFDGASMKGTIFKNANLEGARGLTAHQLSLATGLRDAVLDGGRYTDAVVARYIDSVMRFITFAQNQITVIARRHRS